MTAGKFITVRRVLKELGITPSPELVGEVTRIIAHRYFLEIGAMPATRITRSKNGPYDASIFSRLEWRERIINTINHIRFRDERQLDMFPLDPACGG